MIRRELGHTLIVGKTMYGKTTIVKKIVRKMAGQGKPILVLTTFPQDADWIEIAAYATDDPDAFIETVFLNTGCVIVVDEGGEMAGQFDKATAKLATRGRHNGHMCFFISQRPTDINISIRNNCSNLLMFRSAKDDCRELHKIFVNDAIMDGPTLEKGECIAIIDDQPAQRWRVFEMA